MYRNLPNLLTLLRLILVPLVASAIWAAEFRRAAWLIFIAGWTDALDGFLARRFRWTSRVGAYLDPIADKLLLVSTYLALGLQGAMPAWLVGLVLGRDALILCMVAIAFLYTTVRSFPPTVWGKLSTIVQVFTALATIVLRAWFHPHPVFETFILSVTGVITCYSGLDYFRIALRRFPEARRISSAD